MAHVLDKLMKALGYSKYFCQGMPSYEPAYLA